LNEQVSKVDEIDQTILQIIQKEPLVTHTEIAKRVKRSQPTVGIRIKKLEDLGFLNYQAGMNIRLSDLYVSECQLYTTDINETMRIARDCPFMINAFKISGAFNVMILIIGFNIQDLDKIVNYHFRNNPKITKISMNLITDILNDFVINLDFQRLYSIDSNKICCLELQEKRNIV
jgi:DNA-binding Lrp family transcriptional regulator